MSNSNALVPPLVPRKAVILLVILTLVWGTNWPLFRLAAAEVSVWTFRSISLVIAGCVLLLVAKLRGESLRIERKYWPTISVATLFYLVIWNLTSTYAALMIPSGQAAILGFTMPLWTALITSVIFGERMSGRVKLAMLLGAVSVALLMYRGLSAYAQAPLGFALGLLSGLGWAIGTVILKRSGATFNPIVLTGWQLLLCAVPLTIGALILGDHQWFIPSTRSILVIAWIALVPMCIGNLCWFSIVGLLPANIAGISSVMVPVVAMLSAAIAMGDPLGPLQWLSMLCSSLAVGLILLAPATPRATA